MKKETKLESYSFSVPMITKNIEVTNAEPAQIADPHASPGKQRAVAIVGDRFYHGQFFPSAELEKAYAGWENTLHDINHMGTMHFQGMTATSDILYFVGYNKNVSYDIESKSMSMDIHIKEDTMYGKAWQAYVDLCEEAGQIPNVSIHFMAESKAVQVKDLPKGVNYAEYGLKDTDYVKYIYNIQPRALSTVFRGVCNDSQGCGIGKCSCSENDTDTDTQTVDQNNTENNEEKQALIKWLKENPKGE